MKNIDKPKKRILAKSIQKRNPIKDFVAPLLHKVATKITADDPVFIPQYSSNPVSVDLIANIPPDLANDRKIIIPHRGTAIIDCGVTIELSPGYKAVINANQDWAKRGLNCSHSTHITTGRVKIIVNNTGKETILVKHLDKIAQMIVEPIYVFDWDFGGNP